MVQIKDEVYAALREKKYITGVEKKPWLRQRLQNQIKDCDKYREDKPHLHGLTRSLKETLARAIIREGPEILEIFLDPKAYYGLVVDNAPVLYPDSSYVKKGDTIVHKEIKDDVDGHPFKLQLVARGPDITDDGVVYWVLFEN